MQVPLISVRNRQRKLRVDVRSLQRFAERALAHSAGDAAASTAFDGVEEISVLLVSDARITDLHKQFMDITGPTDVITFQHGEIFVSVETAERQAREYQTSLGHELRLYVVHGILHLLGFDDTTGESAPIMHATQERILASGEHDAEMRR